MITYSSKTCATQTVSSLFAVYLNLQLHAVLCIRYVCLWKLVCCPSALCLCCLTLGKHWKNRPRPYRFVCCLVNPTLCAFRNLCAVPPPLCLCCLTLGKHWKNRPRPGYAWQAKHKIHLIFITVLFRIMSWKGKRRKRKYNCSGSFPSLDFKVFVKSVAGWSINYLGQLINYRSWHFSDLRPPDLLYLQMIPLTSSIKSHWWYTFTVS